MKHYGLYIHIPFCKQKCFYCDFASYSDKSDIVQIYLKRMITEMERYKGACIDSIYIGGGTPTMLSEKDIYQLFDGIHNNFIVRDGIEITTEANPDSISKDKISAFHKSGVNRVSIGLQSAIDSELKLLGRVHDTSDFDRAMNDVISSGISNISADVMMNIPKQTEESLIKTLDFTSKYPLTHISCYGLKIEEGTPFFKMVNDGKLSMPDEDLDRTLYYITKDYLQKKGFNRYEISNFAKDGYECKHNLKYWNADEYIGVGVAAASYYKNRRYENEMELDCYLCNDFVEYIKVPTISEKEQEFEYIMLRLRLDDGIVLDDFYKRFGSSFLADYDSILKGLFERKLITRTGDTIKITDYGVDISNYIFGQFFNNL